MSKTFHSCFSVFVLVFYVNCVGTNSSWLAVVTISVLLLQSWVFLSVGSESQLWTVAFTSLRMGCEWTWEYRAYARVRAVRRRTGGRRRRLVVLWPAAAARRAFFIGGGGGVGGVRPDERALKQRTRWTGVFSGFTGVSHFTCDLRRAASVES